MLNALIHNEKYREILLNCIVASKLGFEGDPFKLINYNNLLYPHGISKLVKSEREANYIVCDCSNENGNILLVSFALNKSMKEIFSKSRLVHSEIKDTEGKFQNFLYEQARKIPINCLIDKIVNNNCQIILTCEFFGASLAALVAIRILTSERIFKDKSKRDCLLCVSFGCPAFSDLKFQEFIDKDCKENFHFYTNEDDCLVETFDILLEYLTTNDDSVERDEIAKIGSILLNYFLGFSEMSEKYIDRLMKAVLNIRINEENKFKHFGSIFRFNASNIIAGDNKNVSLINKKSHFVRNYLNSLGLFLFKMKNPNITNKPSYKVAIFDEFIIHAQIKQVNPEDTLVENTFSVKILRDVINFYFHLKLCCNCVEFLINAEMVLYNNQNEELSYIMDNFKLSENREILFKFTIPDRCFNNQTKIKWKIFSHFNCTFLTNTKEFRKESVIIPFFYEEEQ